MHSLLLRHEKLSDSSKPFLCQYLRTIDVVFIPLQAPLLHHGHGKSASYPYRNFCIADRQKRVS